ncbi:MAG: glycerophosphodiester phosphodiesterase family protein [Draconibacterium sp.]|nr:glycerophosphodiester phosphodiesterase family protein [Draconibacterium sp.]
MNRNLITVRLLLLLLFVNLSLFAQKSDLNYITKEFNNAKSNTVLVAAHRGAHIGNCENSVLSTKQSIKLGVDIIELDIKISKDGVPMLMHDRTIERTTNGKGKIEDYTLAELKQFRLKNWLGILTDETIPTFEDVLKITKGNIMIDIDLKTGNLKPIVEVVNRMNVTDQVFYFDNDYNALRSIKEMDDNSIFMPRAYSYEMADSALHIFKPAVVHIDPSFYTKKVGKLLRNNNSRIWINSLGEADAKMRYGDMEKMFGELTKYGANIIQTNEPAMLLEYLRAIGLHK